VDMSLYLAPSLRSGAHVECHVSHRFTLGDHSAAARAERMNGSKDANEHDVAAAAGQAGTRPRDSVQAPRFWLSLPDGLAPVLVTAVGRKAR